MARYHDLWHRAAGLIGAAGVAAAIAACGSSGNSSSSGNPITPSVPSNSSNVSGSTNPDGPSNPYRIGSMASEFLQSKTQIHILADDDKVAPGCQQKRFVKADVVSMPIINTVGSGGVTERKWIEQWTLDRCGAPVPYNVFFTEVGDGGAYFAVRPSP